jgi:hypothetical protein
MRKIEEKGKQLMQREIWYVYDLYKFLIQFYQFFNIYIYMY